MDRKYLNIYNGIVSKIENKEYQCNDKLPSEKELMGEFNVSRDTIRKSLNMLEQNGYIQKTKGKGSFVLDINKFDFPVSGVVSFKEIASELGLKIAYAKKEITVQNATEEDKKYLDMKSFDMVVVVKSYTYLDDTSLFQYTESRHRPDKFVFIDFARRH